MTPDQAIGKVIAIATKELGYLEKASNANLDDKTANAGSGNFTKYWRDIKPEYQGQPWCACFVTWCLEQAFGRTATEKLLKHYPYVYCLTMKSLFTLNANPKRGDIVVFYRNGTFAHTGIVTAVNGDLFTTIEGNTSGASGIVANGGGVCKKSYYNSQMTGTKFVTLNWSVVADDKESEDEAMTKEERVKFNLLVEAVQDLTEKVDELRVKTGYYNYIDSNMPKSYKPTIQKLVGKDLLQGNEKGELMLTTEMMRILTIIDRTGIFG